MRLLCFCLLSLTAFLSGFAQTAANTGPGLPQDPREFFAAAAPFYDFASPDLKPWHLKATYQLYDEKGKPSEQGTYEYWWASPTIHRSTWTRPSATHTDWYSADEKRAHKETGDHTEFFEYELQSVLLSPLPDSSDLDPDKSRLSRETASSAGVKLPCVMVTPLMPQQGHKQSTPLGLFPTYCFDQQSPMLRARYSFGNLSTEFSHIVNLQNRYLACEIAISDGNRKVLSAQVDTITLLDPADPALTPPADATEVKLDKAQQISALVMSSMLLKQQAPIYPQDAKNAHASGTVVLRAIIGTDGSVHDLRVVSAPYPSLAASALRAVSHWEYKPYLVDGAPVDVETTVNVIYALGN
jgi:TonB family protein